MQTVQQALAIAMEQASAPAAPMQFQKDCGLPLVSELQALLQQVHTRLHRNHHTEHIEVEARLGMIVRKGSGMRATHLCSGVGVFPLDTFTMQQKEWEFLGGVSACDHSAILSALSSHLAEKTSDMVYSYADGLRLLIRDGKCRRWEKKTQELALTYLSPSSPYDMRVTVSLEKPVTEDPPSIPSDWLSKRSRVRKTFVHNQCWVIDVTAVTTQWAKELNRADTISLEVEFELKPTIQQQWLLETDLRTCADMTLHLAQTLQTLLQETNPVATDQPLVLPRLGIDSRLEEQAVRMCAALRQGFPGAMPHSLCMQHVSVVQSTPYFVCEKTDGVRYLLVIMAQGCVLLDRSMKCVAQVSLGCELPEMVLDGELVNMHGVASAAPTYMIFDLLQLNGTSLMTYPFSQRFQQVTNVVLPAYTSGRAHGATVALVQKRFFQRCHIGQLMKCITKGSGMQRGLRVYKDASMRSWHKTDGVIFQPDTACGEGLLLKWKYPDLASIDLRCSFKDKLVLSTDAPSGSVDMSATLKVASHDQARLMADMQQAQLPVAIAEFAHDRPTGTWKYLGLRSDKHKPNFITTVMSTMLEICENMNEEELIFRMTCPTAEEDDWDYHSQKMAHKLKEWHLKKHSEK